MTNIRVTASYSYIGRLCSLSFVKILYWFFLLKKTITNLIITENYSQ